MQAFFLALRNVGLAIITVLDTLVGSSIIARFPMDIWSFDGLLVIDIIDMSAVNGVHPTHILVRGRTEIEGQIYDSGKSISTLHEVFLAGRRYIDAGY
ncbi:MAG: hypothetical protein NVS2B12_12930 [Ktedonobacteraceae bacterium]